MSSNIVFRERLGQQSRPIEEFFKIILIDKKIIPVIDSPTSLEMKLEGLLSAKELENKLNSLIKSINISLAVDTDFPKTIVLQGIQESKEEFQLIDIGDEKRIFQNNYLIQEIPNSSFESLTVKNTAHWGMDILLDFCRIKYDSLERLESIILSNGKEKLKTKFSVGDLSLLFRLLKDEGLIDTKNNAELYRFISTSFSTKSSDSISDKSIKNKFLTPDNTAIVNMKILLANLKNALNKL